MRFLKLTTNFIILFFFNQKVISFDEYDKADINGLSRKYQKLHETPLNIRKTYSTNKYLESAALNSI